MNRHTHIPACIHTHTHTHAHAHAHTHVFMYTFVHIDIFTYVSVYIYIYGNPAPHELPTLVLYRKNRSKPGFPAGPDSVSFQDCPKPTHISRESTRSLVQVRREHARNGNTVLFQSTTNFFLRKTKTTCFGKLYGQTPQRWFFGSP